MIQVLGIGPIYSSSGDNDSVSCAAVHVTMTSLIETKSDWRVQIGLIIEHHFFTYHVILIIVCRYIDLLTHL